MNRAELIDRLWEANRHLLTRRDAEATVIAVFNEIAAALSRGDRVELRGFGVFSVRKLDARTGRDPRTGQHVVVSEKHRTHFKAGKPLHERLQKQINAEAPREL